jgi:hypothetical protein
MPKMLEQFSAKRKYPKKKPPHAALTLRSSGLIGVFRRGIPAPAKNAMHPCIAPVGQIRSNPAVLGAASRDKNAPAMNGSVRLQEKKHLVPNELIAVASV